MQFTDRGDGIAWIDATWLGSKNCALCWDWLAVLRDGRLGFCAEPVAGPKRLDVLSGALGRSRHN